MNDAILKIKMLNASMRCFIFGLLALLPIIGIPFGVVALIYSARVRALQRRMWNAGHPYQIGGLVCAALGLIIWSFFFILILWHLLNPTRD